MKIPQFIKKTRAYQRIHDIYSLYLKRLASKRLRNRRQKMMRNYGEKFYLNIGAGKFVKDNWRIMDYGDYSSDVVFPKDLIDFNINLIARKSWPIADGSVDLVYCSHCLEHLGTETAQFVFKEVLRILKKDGVFRVTLPDMDLLYAKYIDKDFDYFKSFNKNLSGKENIDDLFLKTLSPLRDTSTLREDSESMSKEDFLNKYTPPVNFAMHDFSRHINWFNHDILKNMALQVGFSKYLPSSKRLSVSPEMNSEQFDKVSEKMSLFADIIK
jgi:SAM-dependent methyltransferase